MQFLTVFTALSLPLAWVSPYFRNNFTVGQIVKTSSGAAAGHAATKYSEALKYLGIPFAQSPVGDLRFAAPVKYTGSSMPNGSVFGTPTPEILAASNVTDVGLELINLISQPPDVVYSEDCLCLNVWSKPQLGEQQKAVMVYIYGGGFSGGSSMPIFNGAALADQQDVIIVTLNYRLSILGFLENPTAQNNLAFLDQRLAIGWVWDNITNFGGDPARIILFGQSAGDASADYLAYAYASDPIAAGIIAQSGTAFSFGLPYTESVAAAAAWYTVTAAVGCGNASINLNIIDSPMRQPNGKTTSNSNCRLQDSRCRTDPLYATPVEMSDLEEHVPKKGWRQQ